jgi:hypothetical protein
VQRVVKINEQEYPVSSIRTEPVKASSQTIPGLTGNPKDALEPLAGIKSSGKQAIDIPGSKGFDISKFPQYDKVIASSETIFDKELVGMVKADKGRGFLGLSDTTKDIFRMERGMGKPSTPFSFAPSKAEQAATVSKQCLKDIGVIPSSSAAKGGIGALFGASEGMVQAAPFGVGRGGSNSGGGMFDVGRGDSSVILSNRKARKEALDERTDSFVYPNVDSIAKDVIKSFQGSKPSNRTSTGSKYSTGLKIENLIGTGTKSKNTLGLQLGGIEKTGSKMFQGQNRKNDLLSGLLSDTRTSTSTKESGAVGPRFDQFTGPISTTKTRTTLTTVNISTNLYRNIPTKFFYGDYSRKTEPKKKKGKKMKVKNRKFTVASPLAAVLGPFGGIGKEVQKFSDAFDNF